MIFTRNTPRSTVLPALLVALLLAFGVASAISLVGANAAHAHDQLTATDPADGAALEEQPEQLTLTFSGEIQDIGTTVELVDSEGANHEVGLATDRGDLLVTPQEPLPAGDYTMSWRVTSSDGHPIEGTVANGDAIEFSVAASAEAPASEAPASETPAEASEAPLNPDDPATSGPVDVELDNSNGWVAPLVIIGLALAGVAAVVVVIAKVRNQQK